MKQILTLAVITILLYSCNSARYIPVETVKTEKRDNFIRDSVFRYDSVYVKDKGDTLILERYKYVYRDKIKRDSIFIQDTIRVPYPVEVITSVKAPLSGWQNFQVWCGRIMLILALLTGVYFILKIK